MIRDQGTGIRDHSTAIGLGIKMSKIVALGIRISKNLGSGIKISKNLEIRDQNFEKS